MAESPSIQPDSKKTPALNGDRGAAPARDGLDGALPPHTKPIVPIIGLGGSAGSIQALREFFSRMPEDCGMAFVIVIHLSPDHESLLPQLLQRVTGMPVAQVTEPVRVEADHVYVIPPDKHLLINDGQLQLVSQVNPRGHRVAVDLFFRTLADSMGPHAVGIILSGADGDGAIGLKRIKERGGLTIAQDPLEAEHDAMPRAAIATGMIDWVLPVAQMPDKMIAFRRHEDKIRLPAEGSALLDDDSQREAKRKTSEPEENTDEIALRDVLAHLHAHSGHDFSVYKRATILRRIGRRLQVNSLEDLPAYLSFLRTHPGEASALLQDLLISVTNFFRDPESFAVLEQYLPQLFKDKHAGDSVRCWVAGCATGEEAYSLAMLLCEYSDKLTSPPAVQIFATDIDESAIHAAREGMYPETIVADVSTERLRRFFVHESGHYRVKKGIREMVLFASHNLLKDSPFSRIDLVTCRNLLIYLNPSAQQRAAEFFHFALKPDGLLFLGASETIDDTDGLFTPVDKKHRLYRRLTVPRTQLPLLTLPAVSRQRRKTFSYNWNVSSTPPAAGEETVPDAAVPSSTERHAMTFGDLHLKLLEQYAPPSIVVDENYDIAHLSTSAGRFLQFPAGLPTMNLLKVAHPSLQLEMRAALFRAGQEHSPVEINDVRVEFDEGAELVDIEVRPAFDSAEEEAERKFFLVLLRARPENAAGSTPEQNNAPQTRQPVAHHLNAELQYLKEHLRSTVEQFEASTEDLKASNEELQAMNEELRSTTEELETSKEELQSVNEELITVNQELKSKVEDLSRANSDQQNLMASIDIATIFLDRSLCIKRYTPRAVQLFNLIPTDLHRPLSDLAHSLEYSGLDTDAERVLEQLITIEHELRSTDGHWYLVRMMPYRTTEDKIDGVVLTFVDITRRKRAEDSLRESHERYRLLIEGVEDYAIFAMDLRGCITTWNPGVERLLGYAESEFLGQPGEIIFVPEDRAAGVPAQELETATRTGRALDERWKIRKDGSRFFASGVMTALRDESGNKRGFSKILRDMTESKRTEDALKKAHNLLETRVAERTRELSQTNIALQSEISAHARAQAEREKLLRDLERERHRLSQVLQQMPAGVILAEAPSGRMVFINDKAQTIFGGHVPQSEDIAAYDNWHLLDDHGHPVPSDHMPLARAILKGEVVSGEIVKFKLDEETEISISINAAPIRDVSGQIVAGVVAFEDVTEHKNYEEARRQLLQRVVNAQEEERRRISRELHDQLGQQLTALMMGLKTLPKLPDGAGTEQLTLLQKLTDDLMQQMHHLAWELRPASLDNLGLEAALKQMLSEWSQSSGIRADFISRRPRNEQRLPLHLENAFYRVVQESLTNVKRHAKADLVSVILEYVNDEAVVVVEDNGCGFKGTGTDVGGNAGVAMQTTSASKLPAKYRESSGAKNRLGLIGMRERMELVGGTLTIESTPGKGTTVYARAPLDRRIKPRDTKPRGESPAKSEKKSSKKSERKNAPNDA